MMTKDEKFYRDRCFIQTNAIAAIEVLTDFPDLTAEQMIESIKETIAIYREKQAELIQKNKE